MAAASGVPRDPLISRSLDTIREAAEHFGMTIHTDERLREREAALGSCFWARSAMGLVRALTHRAISTSSL